MIRIVTPEQFVDAFDAVVRRREKELRKLWWEPRKYTMNFLAPQVGVLPQVASDLGLKYRREIGRVDAMFYQPVNGVRAVSIAVEHEQSAEGARREAWTLSLLNVPLKVLVTYPEPGDEDEVLDSYATVLEATDIFHDFDTLKRQVVVFGFGDRGIEWHYYVNSRSGFVPLKVTP